MERMHKIYETLQGFDLGKLHKKTDIYTPSHMARPKARPLQTCGSSWTKNHLSSVFCFSITCMTSQKTGFLVPRLRPGKS